MIAQSPSPSTPVSNPTLKSSVAIAASNSLAAPAKLPVTQEEEPIPIRAATPPPVLKFPAQPRGTAATTQPSLPSPPVTAESPVQVASNAAEPAPLVTPNPEVVTNPSANDDPKDDPSIPGDAYSAAGMPLPNLPMLASAQPEQETGRAQTTQISANTSDTNQKTVSADNGVHRSAQEALAAVSARTGLSDEQEAKLESAKRQIVAGDDAGALNTLRQLNQQLDRDTREYEVTGGESLQQIAGLESTYSNPRLWPLIWHANQERIKRPDALSKNLKLKIPMHPTVQEISAALKLSRETPSPLSSSQTPIARPPDLQRPDAASTSQGLAGSPD